MADEPGMRGPVGGVGGADEPDELDCNETIDRLYHYLDGELTDERRLVIKNHLDECGPCVGAFDFEVELRVVIASHCQDHVPEDLRARIRAAIHEEEQRA